MTNLMNVLKKSEGLLEFTRVYEGLRHTRETFFLSRIMTYRDVLERVYEGLSRVYDSS